METKDTDFWGQENAGHNINVKKRVSLNEGYLRKGSQTDRFIALEFKHFLEIMIPGLSVLLIIKQPCLILTFRNENSWISLPTSSLCSHTNVLAAFVNLQVPSWSLKGELIYPATKMLFYREMGGKGKLEWYFNCLPSLWFLEKRNTYSVLPI